MKAAVAFEGWLGCVQELRRQRAIVVRAAKRIQVGVCGGAFVKWAEAAAELRGERQQAEAAAREAAAFEARKRSILERVVRVWGQRTLASSFSGWLHCAQSSRSMRCVCQKVVRRMLSMKAAVAFEGWLGCVQELRRQRAIVVRAAKRIQVGVCGGACVKWAEAAAVLRRERQESEYACRQRLISYESNRRRVRAFRRMSCVRLVFALWVQLLVRSNPREFIIRPRYVLLQTKRTALLVSALNLFSHWRSLVACKYSMAVSFATRTLLLSAFRSFSCMRMRRRNKDSEMVLACTLLNQVRP
jgi:hypothetical protein